MGGGRFPCLRFAEVAPCRSPQRAKRHYPRNLARPARGVPLGAAACAPLPVHPGICGRLQPLIKRLAPRTAVTEAVKTVDSFCAGAEQLNKIPSGRG